MYVRACEDGREKGGMDEMKMQMGNIACTFNDRKRENLYKNEQKSYFNTMRDAMTFKFFVSYLYVDRWTVKIVNTYGSSTLPYKIFQFRLEL